MPKIAYERLWHGSRPAYYFRKAKHFVSRSFYPLMRWKDYGYNDPGEDDPRWQAKMEAIKSQQSLRSNNDFDISCFPCVDQVLSEAASQRESLSFTGGSSSTAIIAELEDTHIKP